MTARTQPKYTDQQILTLCKSYREHIFMDNAREILGAMPEEAFAPFLKAIKDVFHSIKSTGQSGALIGEPTNEGLILIWPTGEIALLALPKACLENAIWQPGNPIGWDHHLAVSLNEDAPGIPDELIISMYRTRAHKEVFSGWHTWNGQSHVHDG